MDSVTEQLLIAIVDDDLNKAKEALEKGANVNTNVFGNSFLWLVIL
ncbi:MAG: hypothetical protein PG981_001505 [Wolbachia endosymbiont of Ctenocephalides orientis wCori]|nr:MAG: hypothetical protein PG981_001505 [Wolbachia endosymbiont of Ctenocephalides orientis wCori]